MVDINWKKRHSASALLYRGSHTAPTPLEYTMQQLGLVVANGFGLLVIIYRGSYAVPTPLEYTIQQLGLVVAKGFGLLFCQASMIMEVKPKHHSSNDALSCRCTDSCTDALALA